MKDDFFAKLDAPYANEKDADGRGLARALGVDSAEAWSLYHELFRDLDPQSGGIRWWQGRPDSQRCCLIGPHLVGCARSVHYNLVEAGIHLREADDWIQRESDSKDRAAAVDRNGRIIPVQSGLPRSAREELPEAMSDLHVGEFTRSVGSALDLLGGVMVGVLGLRTPIVSTDFHTARNTAKTATDCETEGVRKQMRFGHHIDSLVGRAGVKGWLKWTLDYRNMFVHRPRRLIPGSIEMDWHVLGPDGRPILKTRIARLMPRDPSWTELQAWQTPAHASALTESAMTTLEGVKASTVQLVDNVSRELSAFWKMRRDSPDLIIQPIEQWPIIDRSHPVGFEGYAPGEKEFDPAVYSANPHTVRMLQAGHVFDDKRDERWPPRKQ